jgi:hypothetical protein
MCNRKDTLKRILQKDRAVQEIDLVVLCVLLFHFLFCTDTRRFGFFESAIEALNQARITRLKLQD